MARQLDQVLVIDVESTCWEESPPPGQFSEIIEIGIATLDIASGHRLEKHSVLVRPEHSTVGKFCTLLTTLTQADVEGGIGFGKACSLLRNDFVSKQRVWASYGDYDRRQFERDCEAWGIPTPFGPTHLNVKNLFALAYGLPHEIGMAEALDMLGLPLEGTHHRGGDDAWNIAAILSSLLMGMRKT